ncbi:MAG: hydroxymethylglutaryl-CoA lyase [bacterium]
MGIKIHEVGMRDGIQNEKIIVPLETKVKWIESLIESGIDILQIGSFVHPVKVPQMADTDRLFQNFSGKSSKTLLSGLVLNEKGYERALLCNVDIVCMGVSASNAHSLKNTGMSTEEATNRICEMAKKGLNDGKFVQCSVQSAFGCGFEGKIDESVVYDIIRKYVEIGVKNISLADTAGHAYPEQIKRMMSKIKSDYPEITITVHFHNTFGLGIANCYTGINEGAEVIETAFGGLGGCPFTKVAAGNVATEDLIHSLNRENKAINIDIQKIITVSKEAEAFFNKPLEGYIYKTGIINY